MARSRVKCLKHVFRVMNLAVPSPPSAPHRPPALVQWVLGPSQSCSDPLTRGPRKDANLVLETSEHPGSSGPGPSS